eukprot:403350573
MGVIMSFLILKLQILFTFGTQQEIDPKVAKIVVSHLQKYKVKNNLTGGLDDVFTSRELEQVQCKDIYFNYTNKNETGYGDVYNLQCIKDKQNLTVGGSWGTNKLDLIDICLQPCQKDCANQSYIQNYLTNVIYHLQIMFNFQFDAFQLRFVNHFIDFSDMDYPIKELLEDKYFLPIQSFQQKSMNIFVKQSQAYFDDSLLSIFSPAKTVKYSQVSNVHQYTANVDYQGSCYIKISVRIDYEKDESKREVYSFTDLLSNMGGIFSAIFGFGAVFVKLISENIFYQQIIKDLYQTNPSRSKKSFSLSERKQKQQLATHDSEKGMLQSSNISRSQTFNDFYDPYQQTSNQTVSFDESQYRKTNEQSEQNICDTQTQSQKSIVQRILQEILIRVNLKFSFCDLCKACLKSKKEGYLKKMKRDKNNRNNYLFHKGVEKINKEFDVISLMKLMKQFKLLTKILLNPTQRILLGFQKRNVLDSESSSNDSEDDEIELTRKIRSDNKFVTLMSLGKLKKHIDTYFLNCRNFDQFDQKIINGVIAQQQHQRQPSQARQFVNQLIAQNQQSQDRGLLDKMTNNMFQIQSQKLPNAKGNVYKAYSEDKQEIKHQKRDKYRNYDSIDFTQNHQFSQKQIHRRDGNNSLNIQQINLDINLPKSNYNLNREPIKNSKQKASKNRTPREKINEQLKIQQTDETQFTKRNYLRESQIPSQKRITKDTKKSNVNNQTFNLYSESRHRSREKQSNNKVKEINDSRFEKFPQNKNTIEHIQQFWDEKNQKLNMNILLSNKNKSNI